MEKKSSYGIWGILAAAVIAIVAVSIYGKTLKLNYIEQIHCQEGYLYYVDREERGRLKIIRSDLEGKQGNMILCKKNDREKYQIIRQIFFDDRHNTYVLLEQGDVESWEEKNSRVYRCDFERGRLCETKYDLTEDAKRCSKIEVQCIRNEKLYYIGILDSAKSTEHVYLYGIDQDGQKERVDEIPLEYPNLNAQFFFSEDRNLLWMDYEGRVFAKKAGTDHYLEIEGITMDQRQFKSLSDDGSNAYVVDYNAECIWCIDLSKKTGKVLFSQEEIEKKEPGFTFQRLNNPDCTPSGFSAGLEDEEGRVTICSYQNGVHRDFTQISLAPSSLWRRMFPIYAEILLTAGLLCLYWLARVKYHVQTILVRLCLVFLLGLLVMDGFLEQWIGGSVRQRLEGDQILALSALGKVLSGEVAQSVEQNSVSEDKTPVLSDDFIDGKETVKDLSIYVYSIFRADEKGRLYVSKSASEYSGVPVEWVYAPNVAQTIYHAYETGKIVNKSDETSTGKRNNQFVPVILKDGAKYGILAVSVDGNMLDYQIWYYQWNLKRVSSILLIVLTVILMVILYIFLRPLKTLKECAGKLADGDLGVTVKVHGHDEVADISAAFNQMSLEIAKHVQDIRGMSDGYYKFIPAKILDLLGKESIQEVSLGDQIMGDFTILSLYAMDYPKQTAAMTPEQVYADINRTLSTLVEPISSHHGVVEHFEDTGLSAFFTVSSREALDAAIDIQRHSEEVLPGSGRTIAISYGRVMIGVIGHEQRMEATTISAHSDLAKALRLKGEKYGAHILITHLVYSQIPNFGEHYHARYLGNIYLSASDTYERIYDVYDGDPEEEFYYKELTKPLFEEGVGLFVAKKFYEARLVFVEVLKQHRKDKAAKEYLYRCDRYYKIADGEEIDTVIEKL